MPLYEHFYSHPPKKETVFLRKEEDTSLFRTILFSQWY